MWIPLAMPAADILSCGLENVSFGTQDRGTKLGGNGSNVSME